MSRGPAKGVRVTDSPVRRSGHVAPGQESLESLCIHSEAIDRCAERGVALRSQTLEYPTADQGADWHIEFAGESFDREELRFREANRLHHGPTAALPAGVVRQRDIASRVGLRLHGSHLVFVTHQRPLS